METFMCFHRNFNLHTLVVTIIFFMVVCYTLLSIHFHGNTYFYTKVSMATAATPSSVILEHGAEHPNYNSVLKCTVNSNEIKHGLCDDLDRE